VVLEKGDFRLVLDIEKLLKKQSIENLKPNWRLWQFTKKGRQQEFRVTLM
jgi:hypothetical protein